MKLLEFALRGNATRLQNQFMAPFFNNKNSLMVLFFGLLVTNSYSQNNVKKIIYGDKKFMYEVVDNNIVNNGNVFHFKYDFKMEDLDIIAYSDTLYKNIRGTARFKNGKQVGAFGLFDENGITVYESFFVFGDKVSEIYYYKNGQEKIISHFYDDKKSGLFCYFYESGQIASKEFTVNDTLYLKYYEWYENGQLKNIIPCKNSADKIGYHYYENGVPHLYYISEKNWDRIIEVKDTLGNIIINEGKGQWLEKYSNGVVKTKGSVSNGRKIGKFSYYYPNGVLSGSEQFKNGYLDGVSQIYDSKGILKYSCEYKKGLKEGEEISYKNSIPVSKLKFKKGVLIN